MSSQDVWTNRELTILGISVTCVAVLAMCTAMIVIKYIRFTTVNGISPVLQKESTGSKTQQKSEKGLPAGGGDYKKIKLEPKPPAELMREISWRGLKAVIANDLFEYCHMTDTEIADMYVVGETGPPKKDDADLSDHGPLNVEVILKSKKRGGPGKTLNVAYHHLGDVWCKYP